MTKEDSDKAGVDAAQAWRYFRVDNGKASMAPHPERADWYRLFSTPLANRDDVGVVGGWKWPDPFEGVTVHDLRKAQAAVSEGGPWRADVRAEMWVGKPIAQALRLDIEEKRDAMKVKMVLATCTAEGMFVEFEGEGRGRHPVKFVKVGTWVNDYCGSSPIGTAAGLPQPS